MSGCNHRQGRHCSELRAAPPPQPPPNGAGVEPEDLTDIFEGEVVVVLPASLLIGIHEPLLRFLEQAPSRAPNGARMLLEAHEGIFEQRDQQVVLTSLGHRLPARGGEELCWKHNVPLRKQAVRVHAGAAVGTLKHFEIRRSAKSAGAGNWARHGCGLRGAGCEVDR